MQNQKTIRRIIFTIILAQILNAGSFAQNIHVKGIVDTDTTWTADTVKVDSTVMVKAGARLTIPAGTYIEFQGYFALEVEGELWAEGTKDDTIVFTIRDTTGFSNLETSDGAWHGIRLDGDGDPWVSKIKYCIIEYSKAMHGGWNHNYGGGIYARVYDSLEVSNCIIRNNYADNYGGGIYIYACSARITNNKIYNNRTHRSGGGLGVYFDEPVIMNNKICNNFAQSGSGVYFNTSDPVFANNIICNNAASVGPGGLFILDCDVKSINNTICYNKAPKAGGIFVGTHAKPVFINNIIWANEADEGPQIWLQDFNPEVPFYNCNIQGGASDIGLELGSVYFGEYIDNIDTLPGFTSPPAGAGMGYSGLDADWSLQLGSSCINTGTNAVPGHYLPENDIAGYRRISYNTIDIGAYEFNLPSLDVYEQNITENTTWTADTVKVHGNIYIQDTYTLTINPGVMVQFQGPYKIEVNGTLLALGTETDSIIFTINDTTGFADLNSNTGGWNGIQFFSYATNDSSKIFYSRLEYGKRLVGSGDNNNGGAIYAKSFYRLLISNSTIVNNMAQSGGGIRCSNAPITVRNTTISNNRATTHNGGGINCNRANMKIINCIISFNESADDGGGIDVYGSDPLIENCIISHNIAPDDGGGINSHYNARPVIFGNIISYNSASTGGGIFNEEDAEIVQNQICNNTAENSAGVLFSNDGDLVFNDNIVCNNQAENRGGGVQFAGSNTTVSNNTIVNNYAGNEIGGIAMYRYGNRLINNIIWGNHTATDSVQLALYYYDTLPDLSNSIIQGGMEGIYSNYGNILPDTLDKVFGSNPGFSQPTDSAGMAFDGSIANWSLKDYSPGINNGDPATGTAVVTDHDIYGNPRIHDGIIDIGAVENQSRSPVILEQPLNYTRCTGDTVEFSVRIAEDAVYQWQKDQADIPGANLNVFRIDTIQPEHDGNYQCIIANGYGTVKSYPAQLRVKLPPEIYTHPEETWAEAEEKTSMSIFATGSDLKYQWRRDGIDLDGKITDELTISNTSYEDEGLYECIVSNTCGTDTTEPVNLFLAPQLCMVTVDPATGNNLVVWEKNSTAPVSHFKIYRESNYAGIYDLLASVPFDDLSVVLDSTADPTSRAFIYKITAVDTSDFETYIGLCKAHKTIHLLVTANPETKATQLDWDRYVGFEYGTYIIYRSDKTYDFEEIDQMASSTSTWADKNPGEGTKYYRIAAEKLEGCHPTGNLKNKADDDPYSHAMSNIEDNSLNTTGMRKQVADDLDIYPNPFTHTTTIEFPNPEKAKYSLIIYDQAGKIVAAQNVFSESISFNRGDLPAGIYYIELTGENIYRGKLIID